MDLPVDEIRNSAELVYEARTGFFAAVADLAGFPRATSPTSGTAPTTTSCRPPTPECALSSSAAARGATCTPLRPRPNAPQSSTRWTSCPQPFEELSPTRRELVTDVVADRQAGGLSALRMSVFIGASSTPRNCARRFDTTCGVHLDPRGSPASSPLRAPVEDTRLPRDLRTLLVVRVPPIARRGSSPATAG